MRAACGFPVRRTTARRRRRTAPAVAAALVALVCAAPVAVAGGSGDDTGRTVTLAGGRGVHLECRGTGSPTVVLVSGTGGAADEWTHVAVHGALEPSVKAVLPEVARYTRVCAYDRPGTTRADDTPTTSTPVTQPTSARDGADDLRAVLAAAGERGPYVLVGASWGAMITELLARTDAPAVAGLVTVDGASPHLRDTMTPEQWSDWMRLIGTRPKGKGPEVPDYPAAIREIRAAPASPKPAVPAVVLTSDHPWDLKVGRTGSTWPAWLAAQERLTAELHARHVTRTDSGHGIAVEQPALVSDAIREVVDAARAAGRQAPTR
ncbi:alpha/beta fold hydrolase [Streptomyces sp. NPDC059835]|uniref:alpha/beta fold hydrolase n=1 Tax=Streptomyces sp. NPDC059835 TaxID=3346967 RepID=UPI0036628A81